jgi:hypothetical protein
MTTTEPTAEQIEAAARSSVDQDEVLKALVNIVVAWNALTGDANYSAHEIQHWLVKHMAPAIDRGRVALKPVDR